MEYRIYHTIKEIVKHAEDMYGSCDAVRYKTGKDTIEAKTYRQIGKDSRHFSNAIEKLGQQGAHIALIGVTSYPWLVSYFGIVNGGSVAVPLDVALPAEELCELMRRADVTMLVVDDIRKDVVEAAKNTCPFLQYIVSMGQEPVEGCLSMKDLLAERAEDIRVENTESTRVENAKGTGTEKEIDPDALCTIMFTSGTTGKSKGVMLTQRNLAENATCLDMKIEENSVILSVLPIHHAYCLSMDILKGFSVGSTICINDSLMRVARNIQLFRPQIMLMVPLMIESLAKKLEAAEGLPAEVVKEKVFGAQFHTIFSGGAYLNPDYIDLFARYGISVLQGYGMTECAPVIATTVAWNQKKDSVGQLLPNCEAKSVDGELWVRGSSVMSGYYKMPEETAAALEDGWLKTGDLGYIDDEGFVYLTGRKKNLIITKNGENVSPEEIENKLSTKRLVAEVLVREAEGVIEAEIFPDHEYAAKAGIEDVPAKLQEIIDSYNKDVPAYKRVYRLKVRKEEFPKTASRKIKREN